MTDQEIRIAIADACGWLIGCPSDSGKLATCGSHPKLGSKVRDLPDYPNDLNAMHEAWRSRIVTVAELKQYAEHLRYIVRRDGYQEATVELLDSVVVFATARQHVKAFLRTIGKWKEEAK